MPIVPADLLAPSGPVEKKLFPGEDVDDGAGSTVLEDRLQAYIDQATTKVTGVAFSTPDDAIRAWALHLTFEAAYMVAVARPSTDNSMVEMIGSQGYAKDQRDALLDKSTKYALEYRDLLAAVPTTEAPYGVPTRSTSLEFDF